MRSAYVVHILAGALGLLSGYVALYSTKGAPLHRRSGMAFVCTMLVMCFGGLVMTIGRGVAPAVNVPAAVLTAYLVITSLITVRPIAAGARRLDAALMLVALAVGVTSLAFGAEALASPDGERQGMPAFPFLMFGVVGTLAGALDLRMIRSGGLTGAARLARHLWRMSFALFIAALSFFLGQSDELPKALRVMPLLALPVLAVIVTMFYWLWRIRVAPSIRRARALRVAQRLPAA
jgi:hypothetical protein